MTRQVSSECIRSNHVEDSVLLPCVVGAAQWIAASYVGGGAVSAPSQMPC